MTKLMEPPQTAATESKSPTLPELIAKLHASPLMASIMCTGAGAGVQQLLLEVQNASQTVIEAGLPYDQAVLSRFLGRTPEKFVTREVALSMAANAWIRARENLVENGKNPDHAIGLGLTAAIASSSPKRADFRLIAAVRDHTSFYLVEIFFEKGLPDSKGAGFSILNRKDAAEFSDLVGVNLLLHVAGIQQFPMNEKGIDLRRGTVQKALSALDGDEKAFDFNGSKIILKPEVIPAARSSEMVIDDSLTSLTCTHYIDSLTLRNLIFIPGSFKPFHAGHRRMAELAHEISGKEPVFLFNRHHAFKPGDGTMSEFSDEELGARMGQFRNYASTMLLRETPLFVQMVEKIAKRRAADPDRDTYETIDFVIGVDTMRKILDPQFCNPDMITILRRLHAARAHFYVASRYEDVALATGAPTGTPAPQRKLVKMQDVLLEYRVSGAYWDMFEPLSCRVDMSSTKIRVMTAAAQPAAGAGAGAMPGQG